MELDEAAPDIDLPLERPLYSPPFKAKVSQLAVDAGDEAIEAEALFNQVYVDKMLLLARIRQALQTRPQISLADLVEQGVPVLRKPYSPAVLCRRVREVLDTASAATSSSV